MKGEDPRVVKALEAIRRADAMSMAIRMGKTTPRLTRRVDRGGTAYSIVRTR